MTPNRAIASRGVLDSGSKKSQSEGLAWRPSWPVALLPVGLFLGLAVIGPMVGLDATKQDLINRLQPPVGFGGSWEHALGTDSLGRDVLARLLIAARLSLVVGLVAATLSAVVGVTLGLLSGVTGGAIDAAVTGLVELVLAIPTIVIGLVIAATLGQGMTNVVMILVLAGWITYARVIRLQTRSLIRSDFVMASVGMGATRTRIAVFHLLPNILPQSIVIFCQQVAAVMIWEASLTYLGIGLSIERISLGGMIREGQQQVFEAPWIGIMPGLVIALAVIGFNMLAEWLQERLDPSRHGRRRRNVEEIKQ
jgi:peptide/nickel transport system permease protein